MSAVTSILSIPRPLPLAPSPHTTPAVLPNDAQGARTVPPTPNAPRTGDIPRTNAPFPAREEATPRAKAPYPFATAEDDAADAEAAHARSAERLQAILDRPRPPRDAAYLRTLTWERHCQGVATKDIADEFEVPERTIRSWLAATRDELAADLAAMRQTHLLLAVDSLRRLLATTWELLEAERDATLPQLEALALAGVQRDAPHSRPSHAPRYITAVLAIQKELSRLLALNVADLTPTTPTPAEKTQIPAETAEPLPSPTMSSAHATTATSAVPLPHGPFPHPREGGKGAGSQNPAETATPAPLAAIPANPTPSSPRNTLPSRGGAARERRLGRGPDSARKNSPFPSRREGGRGVRDPQSRTRSR